MTQTTGGAESDTRRDTGGHTADGGVTLEGLSAGYDGTPVLTDVSAQLPRGAVTAIVGPNGAGKSTLLGAIAGVVRTTAGTVRLPSAVRPALVVQQSRVPERLPITVRDAVRMGRWAHRGPWRRLRREDHERVAEALTRLGIADLADRRLSALSGGQRQRALVAQGLVQDSPVLLLDEPVAGLDVTAQETIADALREAADNGTATVHVTHDLAAAEDADHCLLLSGGALVGQGTPREVLTDSAVDLAWGLGRRRRASRPER
ncbi:zinc ABC transporter ATP-binding protein AztA [Prauserella rugosa]|uniref:Zinc/manganese transport system ATP-binding protein n=1 Tax=Prauserella rugosa TaxID=43354 RepID=A0A660C8F2_9PSEU|nr:zinc ABC transporter ATP-binding protein AztA [Prauserella rugosa]TWH19808.1 zinc/manganese transport system ATP-binding protein [Prauserella rugosa]